MWYYAENDQQRGPVTEGDLESLHRSGAINSETLIWREGMPSWQPYNVARGQPAEAGAAPPVIAAGEVACSQCGKVLPASEVIRYGNANICAECKPIFVQKLKEGVNVEAGPLQYASFGTRFGAKVLDGLILWVVQMAVGAVVGVIIGVSSGRPKTTASILAVQAVVFGFGMLFQVLYNCFFLGKFGATPGKMACKIKVVTPEGGPISYGRAAVRPLAEIVSGLILYIGYLMAAWDPEKRALHDRICNTRVVKR